MGFGFLISMIVEKQGKSELIFNHISPMFVLLTVNDLLSRFCGCDLSSAMFIFGAATRTSKKVQIDTLRNESKINRHTSNM